MKMPQEKRKEEPEVKRVEFKIDGLMEGINLKAVTGAVDVLTGEHNVIVDGETFKKYVDALAVIINAGTLIDRAKEVVKDLHSQVADFRVKNPTTGKLAKNTKMAGNEWKLSATYKDQITFTDVPEGVSTADVAREIVKAAAEIGVSEIAKIVSAITLKPISDDVVESVVEIAEKYGAKTIESNPQMSKPETIVKV